MCAQSVRPPPRVDIPSPRDLLGKVLALNISRGSIRWRIRGYGSGKLKLENVTNGHRSETPWSEFVEHYTSGHLVID